MAAKAATTFLLPVIFAVIEEDLLAGLDPAERFEASGLPAAGDDEEGIRLIVVVDIASVVCLWPLTDDNVAAANPHHIGGKGALGSVKLFFRNHLARVVANRVFFFHRMLGKEPHARTLNCRGADFKIVRCPLGRLWHSMRKLGDRLADVQLRIEQNHLSVPANWAGV